MSLSPSSKAKVRHLVIPDRDFKAFLYDCDGTIADSMPIHFQSWTAALLEESCQFSEDLFYQWAGIPTLEIIKKLNQSQGLDMDAEKVLHRKEALYLKFLPQIKAIPEVVETIEAYSGKIPFAVVSGSPRDSVIQTLQVLNLQKYFQVILGAEDYPRGKPDPAPYLMAASQLNVAPSFCLVFEDAELGVQSAEAAGMSWVKIAPPWERS